MKGGTKCVTQQEMDQMTWDFTCEEVLGGTFDFFFQAKEHNHHKGWLQKKTDDLKKNVK